MSPVDVLATLNHSQNTVTPAGSDISAHKQALCMCNNIHLRLAELEPMKGQGKLTTFRAPSAEGRAPHGPCNLYRKQGGGIIPQAERGPKRRNPKGPLRSER